MTLPIKFKEYRDKLRALRTHLNVQVSPFAGDASDPGDTVDRANLQVDVDVNIGLATHEAVLRREIDDALARIEAGTFAVCERCRAAIGAHRLNAIPYARYCVACERGVEKGEPA